MFKSSVSAFTFIDEIDPAYNRYKIKVRILRLWKGFQRDSGSALEMVLVDEKGTRIHATVEEKVMNTFKNSLKEGESINVDTFQLVNNGYEYKTTPQVFKISFYKTTDVTPCNDFPIDVPEKYFVEFPKIISGVLDQKIFVDVVGQIVSVGPLEDIIIRQKNNTKMDIELRDATDARLVCTLWGSYAEQVKTYADEHKSDLIICVLRFAQVKEFRGKWSISNSYNATKILLDPHSSFFDDFRTRITSSEKLLTVSYKEIETPVASPVTLYEEFFVNNPRKSIGEIVIHDEELVCVTIGTIQSIVDPEKKEASFLRDRAILSPTNKDVDVINQFMLKHLEGDAKTYLSSDSIEPCDATEADRMVKSPSEDDEMLYSQEFLNSIKISGLPHHNLELKIGAPIMLLRNIDPKEGLCNGTRLRVTQMADHVIEAEVINSDVENKRVLIPRIFVTPPEAKFPFRMRRRQFPVALAFAMTINKSQGQTLSMVGLYLPRPVFVHGQLYVAISRVKSMDGLKILITDEDGRRKKTTLNVVYKEIFQTI